MAEHESHVERRASELGMVVESGTRLRRVVLILEASTVALTVGTGLWGLTVVSRAEVPIFSVDLGGSIAYLALLVAGITCALLGLLAAARGRHGWAAVGYFIGLVTPTFFAYVGNLLLAVWVVVEVVMAVRSRRVGAKGIAPGCR